MTDLTDILAELRAYGIPASEADRLAARLISIGVQAAPFRPETAESVIDLALRRRAMAAGWKQ